MIKSPSNGKRSLSEYGDAREINDRLFDQAALEGGGLRQRAEAQTTPLDWVSMAGGRLHQGCQSLGAVGCSGWGFKVLKTG